MADFYVVLRDDDLDIGEVRRIAIDNEVAREVVRTLRAAEARMEADGVELVEWADGGYRPDETEAWIIRNFELPAHIQAAIDHPLDCPLVEDPVREFPRIKGLMLSLPEADKILFQVLDKRNLLAARGITLVHNDNTFRQLTSPGLLLSEDVHAIKGPGGLIFGSLHWARRLFDMTDYYREATDADVEAFAGLAAIAVDDVNVLLENSDTWVRKRLALIVASGVCEAVAPAVIREKGEKYGVAIELRGGDDDAQIVIPQEKAALKRLVQLLDERFYDGPLTETPYLANSKRPVAPRANDA